MTPIEQLGLVSEEAKLALTEAATVAELETVEVQYLGRKGQLTGLLRLVGTARRKAAVRRGSQCPQRRLDSTADGKAPSLSVA